MWQFYHYLCVNLIIIIGSIEAIILILITSVITLLAMYDISLFDYGKVNFDGWVRYLIRLICLEYDRLFC